MGGESLVGSFSAEKYRVQLTHSWVILSPLDKELGRVLNKHLVYEDRGALYVLKRHRREVHPKPMVWCPLCQANPNEFMLKQVWMPYNRNGDEIALVPVGLWNGLAELFSDAEVQDLRQFPAPKGDLTNLNWLRDYQMAAVVAAVRKGRGVIVAPTGSGKTPIGIGVVGYYRLPTLWLVHTQSLLNQTAKEVRRFLPDLKVTIVGAGKWDGSGDVVVATKQSIESKLGSSRADTVNWLKRFSVLVVDECHHASAEGYRRVIQTCINAAYRFGLTATPLRETAGEWLWVKGIIGDIVAKVRHDELVRRSFIAQPKIQMIRCSVDDWVENPSDWHEVYRTCIVQNEERNAKILELINRYNRVLVLVWSLEHKDILAERVKRLGKKVVALDGESTPEEREFARLALTEGKINCVIATDVWKEGVDLPQIDAFINAAGFKSKVATLQRLGRALRPKPDGQPVYVYDFLDTAKNSSVKLVELHAWKRFKTYRALWNDNVQIVN